MTRITANSCRAARAWLNWKQPDLAEKADLNKRTITDFERGERVPSPKTQRALVKTFEEHGVLFLERNGALYCGMVEDEAEIPPKQKRKKGTDGVGQP